MSENGRGKPGHESGDESGPNFRSGPPTPGETGPYRATLAVVSGEGLPG
jgi:hypothetical protein